MTTRPTTPPIAESFRIAAIDVGSNSVHMVVAQADSDGAVTTLWRLKEMVGLGRISFPSHRLTAEAMDRAVASLARCKQAAQQREAEKIVAVATSAVREATNGGDLIERIKRELRMRVRVVSAREEARLIYVGVKSAIDLGTAPQLIVDIGGGSVEFIVGNNVAATILESRKLGAARMTARFVKSDPVSKTDHAALLAHYETELTPLVEKIKAAGFTRVIGTSGTLENIAQVCGGTTAKGEPVIDLPKLDKLLSKLVKSTSDERGRIGGLDDQRKDQFLAGVALVHTLMSKLGVDRMHLCGAALREGILADYLARHLPDLQVRREVPDPRRRSVLDLARRCNWRETHSKQVARLTLRMFDDLVPLHRLGDADRELLEYAALLHDIGWHIGPRGHHKHGQYLIQHGDLKSFAADEIATIAAMVRFHRKSFPNRARHAEFAALSAHGRRVVEAGAALLRIADGLDRSHASVVQDLSCSIRKKSVDVAIETTSDAQLEIWGGQRNQALFEHVFKVPVRLTAKRG